MWRLAQKPVEAPRCKGLILHGSKTRQRPAQNQMFMHRGSQHRGSADRGQFKACKTPTYLQAFSDQHQVFAV